MANEREISEEMNEKENLMGLYESRISNQKPSQHICLSN